MKNDQERQSCHPLCHCSPLDSFQYTGKKMKWFFFSSITWKCLKQTYIWIYQGISWILTSSWSNNSTRSDLSFIFPMAYALQMMTITLMDSWYRQKILLLLLDLPVSSNHCFILCPLGTFKVTPIPLLHDSPLNNWRHLSYIPPG